MSPLKVKAIVLPSGEIAGYRIQLAPTGDVEGVWAGALFGATTLRAAASTTADSAEEAIAEGRIIIVVSRVAAARTEGGPEGTKLRGRAPHLNFFRLRK